MSDIAAVVARSRIPGEFSERRTFTLARKRAIQKMREFALADPYYFVLELIQAAVAKVHDAGGYRNRIDYSAPCQPPLDDEQRNWADRLLQEQTV